MIALKYTTIACSDSHMTAEGQGRILQRGCRPLALNAKQQATIVQQSVVEVANMYF
jgi:hypothetical protein